MTTYLPMYSKKASGLPDLARDPSCVFYSVLSADGNTFKSDDRFGHSCTNYGSVWTPQGRQFTSSTDTIWCGTNPALDIMTSGITMGCWWYQTGALGNYIRLITKGYSSAAVSGCCFQLGLGQTNLLRIGVGSAIDKSIPAAYGAVPLNTWIFLAASSDLKATYFFINGVQVYSTPITGTMRVNTATPLTLSGAWWPSTLSYYAPGIIGDAFIFNTCLHSPEVSSIFRATRARYL